MDSSPLDVMSLPAGQGNLSLPLYKHCQLQGEEKRVILSRPSRRKSHTHTHTHTHRDVKHTQTDEHAHPIYGTHTVRNQIPFKHTCGKAEGLSFQRLV